MIRGVFESVTAKVTDGVGPWMNATRRRAKLRPAPLQFFFTHRRLRTRLFMQVGDERRTNGKNFFHPSHRSFLPLSYETTVRRRRRKNYVYYLVVRGGKYTCCAIKWNSKHHHRFMALFFSAVDKELFSDCQGEHSKSYSWEYCSVSPAGNWISGARRSCQSENIPGQHF